MRKKQVEIHKNYRYTSCSDSVYCRTVAALHRHVTWQHADSQC